MSEFGFLDGEASSPVPREACPRCGSQDYAYTDVDYTDFVCRACGRVWNTEPQIGDVDDVAVFLNCSVDDLDLGLARRFPMVPVAVKTIEPAGVIVTIGRKHFTFVYPFSWYYIDEVIEDFWLEQVRAVNPRA